MIYTSFNRVAVISVLLILFGAGCQRIYHYSMVQDYALFDGQLYLLVQHEEGIDKASPLSHSLAFHPTRRVIGIARCRLDEKKDLVLELVAKREFKTEPYLSFTIALLSSTNSFVVQTARGEFENISLGGDKESETPKRLSADRIMLSASRKLLLGCGTWSWVVDTKSLLNFSNVPTLDSNLIVCALLQRKDFRALAFSDDLSVVAFQNWSTNTDTVEIIHMADIARTNKMALPEGNFTLQSIHQLSTDWRLLFTHLKDGFKEDAVVFDSVGKELARGEILGKPVSDASLTTIVSIGQTQAMQLNPGERLPIKVWLPNEKRQFTILADTSSVLKAMR